MNGFLSVLIRGLGPSSKPNQVCSVLWLVYYGNKLMMMLVNTKLKERGTTHTHTNEMWASNDCISVFNEVPSHMINI